ncbi:MAG: hypothetical protein ACKVOM_09565 [Ferruginibacter sp.]
MTKLNFFLLLLIIVANSKIDAFAQTTIHIEAAETHAPLPYATIVIRTKQLLLFTDKDGNAINNFETGDSIDISYVGYENLHFIFDKKQPPTYLLTQKKSLLSTVEIKSCIPKKLSEYSNEEDDKTENKFGGLAWDFTTNTKVAVMVNPDVKNAFAISFSFWLLNYFQAPKIAIKAPMKLSFYEIVDSTSFPGELITDRQVIYFPKKQGKQTINLDSLHLKIPDNGMYIGIEYILDEKYKYSIKYFDREAGVDTTGYRYGARFDGVISNKFRIAFYYYFLDKWFYGGKRTKSEMELPHGTIKCSLDIKYFE